MRRSSGTPLQKQPPEVFYKKAVLKNFAYNIQSPEDAYVGVFCNKVAGLHL